MDQIRRRWLSLMLLVYVSPLAAFAQECAPDEYVLSVSSIPALREQALSDFEEVSVKRLEVEDIIPHAMLIKEPGTNRAGGKNDLCDRVRSQRRHKLRGIRAGARAERIREHRCSCNAKLRVNAITPNDQYFSIDWGLSQENNVDIDMPEAWEYSTSSNSVVVAVIDTGVDYTHEDLRANIWVNPNEVPDNGIDDDRNGYIDDVHGANTIVDSGNPFDDHGHGTHVSGTIGAVGDNGIGVAGVNWRTKIMGVKFLGANGCGYLYDAVKAIWYITYMRKQGINIKVANNSWGGGGFYSTLYDAIERAKNEGILFVAAAGNYTNNNDASPAYPAGYQLDNVISVAALESNGNLASFSNYGPSSVHIAAPGAWILSTYPGNRYAYMSGTSMAAPHVTGALALLAGFAPSFTANELKQSLLDNGKPMATISGLIKSGKMVSASKMLAASLNGPPGLPTPVPSSTIPSVTPTPVTTPGIVTPTPTPTAIPTAMPGPYTVSGKVTVVVGAISRVAAGAEVRLRTAQGDRVTFTDASGLYSFSDIPSVTDFTLAVFYEGFEFSERSGRIDRNWILNFRSTAPTYELSGVVMSRQKMPISEALIDAGALGTAVTDASGRFTLSVPFGATYRISVAATGYFFPNSDATGVIYGDVERVFAGEAG